MRERSPEARRCECGKAEVASGDSEMWGSVDASEKVSGDASFRIGHAYALEICRVELERACSSLRNDEQRIHWIFRHLHNRIITKVCMEIRPGGTGPARGGPRQPTRTQGISGKMLNEF